jgi:hypothetical protein
MILEIYEKKTEFKKHLLTRGSGFIRLSFFRRGAEVKSAGLGKKDIDKPGAIG